MENWLHRFGGWLYMIVSEWMGVCAPPRFFIVGSGALPVVQPWFVAICIVGHGPVGLVGGTVGGGR